MLSLECYKLSLLIITILAGTLQSVYFLKIIIVMIYKSIKHFSVPLGVSCEELTPNNKEVFSVEGSAVTLSYKYSKQATGSDYFFWYRQYPRKPPEFLISHTGTGAKLSDPVNRLSFHVSDDKKGMDLQISSAAVTDSAVYYCAVTPTVTGNSKTLYKNLWSKDNRILHNIH
uniref:Ig-like domain-containing protein n=1 Tax=Amphilophus citrinellus TaxID=61819 RepID=A0A3Q0SGC9_AMPCI